MTNSEFTNNDEPENMETDSITNNTSAVDLVIEARGYRDSSNNVQSIGCYQQLVNHRILLHLPTQLQSDVFVELGDLLTKNGQLSEAYLYLSEGIKIAESSNCDMRKYNAYMAMSSWHAANGDENESIRFNLTASSVALTVADRIIEQEQKAGSL